MNSTDFDVSHFLRYLKLGFWDYETTTIRVLIENMIDWIEANTEVNIVEFLDDVLPQIHRNEILMFAPDYMLSDTDRKAKQEAMKIYANIYKEAMEY